MANTAVQWHASNLSDMAQHRRMARIQPLEEKVHSLQANLDELQRHKEKLLAEVVQAGGTLQ